MKACEEQNPEVNWQYRRDKQLILILALILVPLAVCGAISYGCGLASYGL